MVIFVLAVVMMFPLHVQSSAVVTSSLAVVTVSIIPNRLGLLFWDCACSSYEEALMKARVDDRLWDESLVRVWDLVVGWLETTSLGLWQESSFLLQTGLTEILAVLEIFGFWLLEDNMFGCDGINGGRRVFIVYEKCGLGRKNWGIVWDKICLWILGSIG